MSDQTKRVASSVAVVGTCPPAGGPAVAAAPKHGVVISPSSPPAADLRPEKGEDDPSHPTPVGLHCRWHRCAVVNTSLNEMLGLRFPASERLEVRRLQKVQQVGDELAH